MPQSILAFAVIPVAALLSLGLSAVREPAGQTATAAAHAPARDYPVSPVPFTAVHLTDGFWAPRIETNRAVTIPFAFKQCEDTGRMDNFDRAAAVLAGKPPANLTAPGYPFDDSDVFKIIEGAAYTLAATPDPKLDAYLDGIIARIAAAQEPDGYLYTTRTINPAHPHEWAGKERWVLDRELSHELYNLGHLYEAAAAHHQATGKRTLLDVALKSADLLCNTFGPDKQAIWPGHEITEMGLVKLYRVTGEEKYLKLAQFLLDVRGPDGHKGAGTPYNQSHVHPVDQHTAVGHAVRAVYLYSGMADVAAMTGNPSYLAAIDDIWTDVASSKLAITGGIGATAAGEAFGKAFELPNMSAYNETCAAIGNIYWNQRLFLLHADAKYIDVLERSLYNGVISGVSLDGKTFFYPNPLESRGQHARQPWFGCACCPSNICRFLASVPGYVYAARVNELYVNLFATGTGTIPLDGGAVKIEQQTGYPWAGKVRLTVTPAAEGQTFVMKVRIPGWARNEAVPSKLYAFEAQDRAEAPTLTVNGVLASMETKNGYATIMRPWRAGDVVELNLPMSARRVVADERVTADRGRVALQRGPVVYCAEWPDTEGGKVRNLLLDDNTPVTAAADASLLGGVTTLTTTAKAYALADATAPDAKPLAKDVAVKLIPYYAWAHRGPGEMAVFFARNESAVRPAPAATIASRAKITASGNGNPAAIADGEAAPGEDVERLHWWPSKGTMQWVEYTFAEPEKISESSIFFFDDTGRGECRVPQSYKLFYKDTAAGEAGAWREVTPVDGSTYATKKDAFNALKFAPITTTALRLEVQLQPNWSAGICEWAVK